MAREDLHFRLRIPEDLKRRVDEAAKSNHRSMTAEIIARLETSFNRATMDGGPEDITISVPLSADLSDDEVRMNLAEVAEILGQIVNKKNDTD